MPDSSTTTRQRPWDPHGHPPLERYIEWLWKTHGEEVEFAVLFGSRARGDALEDSDYDLLLALREEDRLRLTDRIGIYQDVETGKVQVLPYTPSELRSMMEDANGLLLEALADGIPLYDRGRWAERRAAYLIRVRSGTIRRVPLGWEVDP